MARNVKIKKIEIIVGKQTISLSPEELKELKDVLDAAFPKETVYWPSYPVVIPEPVWPKPYRYWEPYVSWSGSTASMTISQVGTSDG